jgi:site-specific DNA-methyltransferase (adenine-specific)
MNESTHQLRIGDATELLEEIAPNAVQLVVTSPPYWSIKDYGCPGQIGVEDSYEEYLDRLAKVWEKCKKALSPGCRLAINIGEQYLRAKDFGEYSIKPIPADLIERCIDVGFKYLGGIIWRKISTTKTTGGCSWMGSIYYPRDGYVTYEHEFVVLFKKCGKTKPSSKQLKEESRLTKEQRSRWFRGIWDDIRPERQNGHMAMFPVEIPERLIRMFTFRGETVLDPFMGSGTTGVAAHRSGRNSIGMEINPSFTKEYTRKARTEGFCPRIMCSTEAVHGRRGNERAEEAHVG